MPNHFPNSAEIKLASSNITFNTLQSSQNIKKIPLLNQTTFQQNLTQISCFCYNNLTLHENRLKTQLSKDQEPNKETK